MRVDEIMKKNLIIASPDTSLAEALILTQDNKIRHLPIVDKGVLVGIVSDRDLRSVGPSKLTNDDLAELLANTPIRDIMHKNVITAHPLDFVEDAASVIYEFKIGCLPVVQKGELVGIVTESDILHTLVELMGVNHPSSHVEVEVDDYAGVLADVTKILKEQKVNVTSIYIKPATIPGKKTIVLRIQTMDPRRICQTIADAGYKVSGPLGGF